MAVNQPRSLGVLLLLALPLASTQAAGWRKDIPDLAAVNKHLAGTVVDYTANHGRDSVQGTERGRPVRHRQTSIIACDQRTQHDQHQRRPGEKHRQAMMRQFVRNRL